MEELIKEYKNKKNQISLKNILSYLQNNINSYSQFSELISAILSDPSQNDEKFEIIKIIIDRYTSNQIPKELISTIGIERLFNIDSPLYSELIDKQTIKDFYKEYFPNSELLAEAEEGPEKAIEIDYLYESENNIKNPSIVRYFWKKALLYKNNGEYVVALKELPETPFPPEIEFIQRCGTMLDDIDFRVNLKKGDKIDFLDSSKTWYLCTVVDRIGDNVSVGFRQYCDDGPKEDAEGRRYFGWNDRFNSESTIFDCRLRKPETFSRRIYNRKSESFPNDLKNYNDNQLHVPLFNNDVFVIPKRYHVSPDSTKSYNFFFIAVANYFFKKITEKELEFTLDSFYFFSTFSDILFLLYDKLTLPFAFKFLKDYNRKAMKLLLEFSATETRNFTKANIQLCLKNHMEILSMVYFENDIIILSQPFCIEFGLNCYQKSTILEKKLLGLTILKKTLYESFKKSDDEPGIKLLSIQPNILTLLFETNPHSQIIQKSYEIIKYLFSTKAMDKTSLEQLYSYTNSKDIEIVNIVYKSLINFAHDLSNDDINTLLEKVISQSTKKKEDVLLMIELAKGTRKNLYKENAIKVLDYIYNLIVNEGIHLTEVDLYKKFYDVVRGDDDSENIKYYYVNYISRLMKDINDNNFSRCISLMKSLLVNAPHQVNDELKSKISAILFEDNNIFNVVLAYLDNGKYNSNLFDFLEYLIEKTDKGYLLTEDVLKRLFDIFIDGSLKNHRANFIKWLKNLLEKRVIKYNSLEFIFNQKMDPESHRELNEDLFNFYWNLFLLKNDLKDKSSQIEERYNGIASNGRIITSYTYTPRSERDQDALLIKPDENYNPFKLEHFDFIFNNIFLLKLKDFPKHVYKFFALFSPKGIDAQKRGEFWRELISRDIKLLASPSSSSNVKRNSISFLTLLIEESEKKGTAGCVSHLATLKSYDITVQIHNQMSYKTLDKDFPMVTKSNITFWDFKRDLSKLLNVIPESIKITIHENVEITDRDNGKLISKFFHNGMKVIVTKSHILDEIPKVALVSNGELTPRAREVFTEIFNRFAVGGKMTPEQCIKFTYVAIECNENINTGDQRIIGLFNKYDKEHKGYLTLENILKFFLDAIELEKKAITVWDNLKAFGYRNDLKRLNEPLPGYNYDHNYAIMPRYVLSNEQEFFEAIFNAQNESDPVIAKEANELVGMICTNEKILNSVLDGDNEWIVNEKNELKLFYLLQIVQGLIENEGLYKDWVKKFIEGNGLELLIKKRFISFELKEKQDNENEYKFYWCMLQIIMWSLKWLFNEKEEEVNSPEAPEERKEVSEVAEVDKEKFCLKDILIKTMGNLKEEILYYDDLSAFKEDVVKKSLEIIRIIILYNPTIPEVVAEDGILKSLVIDCLSKTPSIITRKETCYKLFVIFKKTTSENIRNIIIVTVESIIFHDKDNTNENQDLKSDFALSLYESIISHYPLSQELSISKVELILKNKLDYGLWSFFSILAALFRSVNIEEKNKIIKKYNLLNVLVNEYFLEDPGKPSINQQISDSLFLLIVSLIHENPTAVEDLFSSNTKLQNISDFITSLKQGKETYSPYMESRSPVTNYIGLYNLRNICYMNSVIQQFFTITPFHFAIINARDNVPERPSEINGDDNLLHQLQKMFTFLQLSNRGDFSPSGFVYSLKDFDGNPTDFTVQCDAQEFLSNFMDKIEQTLVHTRFKYLFKNMFYGETCSQVICSECGNIRTRFENLAYLSLDIKKVSTLEKSLEKYMADEFIDDYFCEKCNKKTRNTKRISLNKLPNVLFIHLQRITFNYETFMMEKINSKLEFPMEINMKPYTTEDLMKGSTVNEEEYANKVYDHCDEYYDYVLKGVVVHSGTGQFGHYYSFINTEMCSQKKKQMTEKWIKLDDSVISKYNFKNLKEDTFGGEKKIRDNGEFFRTTSEWEDSSKSAYMLVYERRMKSPLIIVKEETNGKGIDMGDNYDVFFKKIDSYNIENSERKKYLDCEDTASSRNFSLNGVNLKDENIFDQNEYIFKGEPCQLLPFYHFCKANCQFEQKYFSEVLRDNIIYRNDSGVFTKGFSDFIRSVASEVKDQIQYISSSEQIFSTLTHILVNILSKTSFKSEVGPISLLFIDIIKAKPELANVIFKSFLGSKQRWMFTLIVTIDDKINTPFQKLLTESLITTLGNADKESEEYINAIEIFNYLYSLMPQEISKFWTKMVTYLDIFADLSKSGNPHIIKLMLEKETICVLGDFFLGKESPFCSEGEKRNEIGNRTVSAKFAPLITTISRLALHCRNLVNEKSSLYLGNASDTKEFKLTANDIAILTSNAFYKKALCDSYESNEMGRLLHHLMYNDWEFTSRRFISILSYIKASNTPNEIKEVSSLLYFVLKLEDKYFQYRYEAILGIPNLFIDSDCTLKDTSAFKYNSVSFLQFSSLCSKMKSRWLISVDNIKVVGYFFSLMFSSEKLFSYLNSMPHPTQLNLSFVDYVKDVGDKEVDRIISLNLDSRFERAIEIYHNSVQRYDETIAKIQEENPEKTSEFKFDARVEIKKPIEERITKIQVDDEVKALDVFLLRSDVMFEVGESEMKKITTLTTTSTMTEVGPQQELPMLKDKVSYYPERTSGSLSQWNTNLSGPNYYYNNLVKEEDPCKNKFEGDIDNMIDRKEEEKKKLENEEGEFPVIRTFVKEEERKEDAEYVYYRRYLIVNNSNRGRKSTLKIKTSVGGYCPISSLVAATNKNSYVQIFCMYIPKGKDDWLKEDEITFETEEFNTDNENNFEQLLEKEKIQKTKTEEEKFLNKSHEYVEKDFEYASPSEPNGFEYDCKFCNEKNIIGENDEDFTCKKCGNILLS